MNGVPDFETLHGEYHLRVVNYLCRFLPRQDAEDVAQEVFLKVYGKLLDFRGESKISTWIFQIATHAALDRLRSPLHKNAQTHAIVDELSDPGAFHIDPGHAQEPEREEMSACIRDLVRELPLEYCTVLSLSELKELGNEEIAHILDTTPGAVKIRLHRARKALRARMEKACSVFLDDRAEIQCDRKNGA